jgi:hypothetical protein
MHEEQRMREHFEKSPMAKGADLSRNPNGAYANYKTAVMWMSYRDGWQDAKADK